MKKLLLIIIVIWLTPFLFAQNRVSLTVDISEGYDPFLGFLYNVKSQFYTARFFSSTNFQSGIKLNTKAGILNANVIYQLYGNFKKEIPSFTQKNHFLGIDITYRFYKSTSGRGIIDNVNDYKEQSDFQKVKRASPILGLSLLTEVGTNYENRYYDYFNFPTLKPTNELKDNHSSRYYSGTPFVGILKVGYDFNIVNNLHLYVVMENSIRIIQTRVLSWQSLEPKGNDLAEQLEKRPKETTILDLLGFRLGLSYSIPVRKQVKTGGF